MINEMKKILIEYEIVRITETNFKQAMEVYNANQAFFMLTEGKETTIESSINDISAVPPNFNIENKIYVGVLENGKFISVLDLLMGYPEQNCVWIGLLLVHGKLHGKGIGGDIAKAILKAVKTVGYETIQLGVIENNIQGLSFWSRYGFKKIRESKKVTDDANSLHIVVMEKLIV